MSDLSPSAVKLTPAQEAHVQTLSNVNDIAEYLNELSVQQNLRVRDWDPNLFVDVVPGTAPTGFAKTIVVNGVKTVLEAASEQDLLRVENEFYRTTFTQPAAAAEHADPARDASTGRFVEARTPATDAEKDALQLRFQLGQITAAEYVEQSGAVGDYLANQGVDLDTLRELSASKQDARVQATWASATEEFLHTTAGQDWPGGEENLAVVARLLEENNLTDAPSAGTLANVWEYMKENGLAVTTKEDKIASATSDQEIRAALGRSSSFFGQ